MGKHTERRRLTPEDVLPDARRVAALSDRISTILISAGPVVMGATLSELTAMWLAAHPPELRARMMAEFVRCVQRQVLRIDDMTGPPGTRH